VINGARLAPGNSIGLLTYRQSHIHDGIELHGRALPVAADRTNVTGTATLGAR